MAASNTTPSQEAGDEDQSSASRSACPQQSNWGDGLASINIALGAIYGYPLECARLLGTSVQQLGWWVAGTEFRPERNIGKQTGRVVLVTGGNTGLGKQTILQLAKHRPERIYLAARNEAKGRDAIAAIQSALDGPPLDIRYLQLDLASFKSIRKAAAQFTSECDRLDTLVLNAGVMALPPGTTEDGYEVQFGTNHIGHFLFTKLLLPTLQRSAEPKGSDVRVISVSSAAWQMAPSPMSTSLSLMTSTAAALNAKNTFVRYGVSKAANILFAAELARRYPEITAVSIHPGIIFTGLYDAYNRENAVVKYGSMAISPFVAGEERGALNHLWASGVDKEKLTNGQYYTPVGAAGWKNPYVQDAEAGKELWEWTDQQVSRVG